MVFGVDPLVGDNYGISNHMMTFNMATTRLKPKQFDALVSKSRMKEDAVAIARSVLVDGRGYAEAAEEHGRKRQYAYQVVTRLLALEDPEVHTYTGSPEVFAEIDAIVERHKGRKMLTRKQFNALEKLSMLEPHSLELAKGVLVDGVENIELARKNNIARHLPWQASQRLMKRFDPSTETTRVYRGTAEMFEEIDALIERLGGSKEADE